MSLESLLELLLSFSLRVVMFQAESFKIVIQKKKLYMTGDDKQIPIMCVADLGDLTVSNSINVT